VAGFALGRPFFGHSVVGGFLYRTGITGRKLRSPLDEPRPACIASEHRSLETMARIPFNSGMMAGELAPEREGVQRVVVRVLGVEGLPLFE